MRIGLWRAKIVVHGEEPCCSSSISHKKFNRHNQEVFTLLSDLNILQKLLNVGVTKMCVRFCKDYRASCKKIVVICMA